jgi:hypothetical protein
MAGPVSFSLWGAEVMAFAPPIVEEESPVPAGPILQCEMKTQGPLIKNCKDSDSRALNQASSRYHTALLL